jgi:hypothetical protein
MTTRLRTSVGIFLIGISLCLANAFADEKLAGIACRSVHLNFPAPEATAYYNEVTVEKSAEGTYFCVCGFNQGYFGIQEQNRGKKVVIFSVWDPGKQDDPNSVDLEKRVKLVSKDEKVRVGRFGNEGTGGQSFLDLDWKPGETYRFLVTAKIVGERTEYASFIAPPEAKEWRHLATFSTLAKGKLLGGYYSFIEDFKRNKISATIERRAKFGEGYVQTKDGKWLALGKARFTGDSNPAKTIDAGIEGDRYFLATGGQIENKNVPLNKTMELRNEAKTLEVRPERIPELR